LVKTREGMPKEKEFYDNFERTELEKISRQRKRQCYGDYQLTMQQIDINDNMT